MPFAEDKAFREKFDRGEAVITSSSFDHMLCKQQGIEVDDSFIFDVAGQAPARV